MTILDTILDHKRDEVAVAKRAVPEADLRERIAAAPSPRSLRNALLDAEPVGFIAELKKASPSAGVIRPEFDPAAIARGYAAHGAAGLSVLTDSRFFQGSLAVFDTVRATVDLPLLRKDFLIDAYQVREARVHGADAVLLIVAALDPVHLADLLAETRELGMAALVEVHTAAELETALAAGADLVGVNNRDLATFAVDLGTTEAIAAALPDGVTLVAESGIRSGADVARMAACGARGVLVGTHFMSDADPGAALGALREEARLCCA